MKQGDQVDAMTLQRQIGKALPALGALGLGVLAIKMWESARRKAHIDLPGQVVLITGSSRGLGLQLAREFAAAGCRLVLCARDQRELERAQAELVQRGADVLALPCNVADQTQVNYLVEAATDHYGGIDILVNNAGIIDVGPLENRTLADFEHALDVIYWGTLYPIWAVLPQMRARKQGRIVNITSIGGKVSIPHLLPYGSAKFATVGLSEGLRAELAKDGIVVTTIVPGLMRTGSFLNASFKGNRQGEFTWFSLGSSLPFISMDAALAARQIVEATQRGDAMRVLSLPARLLATFHNHLPGITADILGVVNRVILPDDQPGATVSARGMDVQEKLATPRAQLIKTLTTLGQKAAVRLHQLPPSSQEEETVSQRSW